MLNRILSVGSEFQKHRGYGVLQVGCVDEVVSIELLISPGVLQTERTVKIPFVGVRLFQEDTDGMAVVRVHEPEGLLVEK